MDEHVDTKIAATKADIATIDGKTQVAKIPSFSALPTVELPFDETRALLGKTLADVVEEAESAVRDHITSCLAGDEDAESWLQQGTEYLADENPVCPYCGRAIGTLALIEAYRGFFSEAYDALKQSIADALSDLQTATPGQTPESIASILKSNADLVERWLPHIDFAPTDPAGPASTDASEGHPPAVDVAKLVDPLPPGAAAWQDGRTLLAGLLAQKAAAPLELVALGLEFSSAEDQCRSTNNAIEAYNSLVDAANARVAALAPLTVRLRLGKLRGRHHHPAFDEIAQPLRYRLFVHVRIVRPHA